ncbi:hypothetical protein BBO99_00003388 [Phytophthora kernoviae]|uniref:Serine/threonine-protein phosphatase 4 regulatory subunit 3-like central domain-containing protein n=2 Tax=Phytophthora kernoviae TaxID=325452 RepID=A0A3R7IJI6_9STRA|nr:hypothetical protein G195_003806 [Phytophthora kernoviae 00238/432]KAG2531923.1 hypothetical protein JM16_000595 [Phytophthora kernoviae]KAG2532301.1 hypothetical protein JM18_000696 [Phytophthora kernoviae]RLN25791.1 hypothetical protein BBI17_003027 [Phytophthora kernoviae]RLN81818.1 hypothetical protein BBO99_00003388 [Phytophthora kernoviae]
MDSDMSIDQFFRDDIKPLDLPPCDVEHLDEILMVIKTAHPSIRTKVQADLIEKDGAYIVKLLDFFDVCELDDDRTVLHKLFDIFYGILQMCNRSLIDILLSDTNFISVVGVFGYNPGLIREMDFRSTLEGETGFNEVIAITDRSVVERVHINFRIQVIKDNVLSRSLPDGCVLLLEHMTNENNYHILSYISETDEYWKEIKDLIRSDDKRLDGLGLLKAIINLVRVTKPIDKLSQPRREPFGAPPVFSSLIGNLFGGGELFEAFASVMGSPYSKLEEITLAVDILNLLVFFLGPDRLRAYLASEGKCVPAPISDKDRISWGPDSSLFTAMLVAFERYESVRAQMFTLLREIFRLPLAHDDKFLSVLYPNYMHWLLQPLKINASPIASYAEKMLRSKNKLFVIHAVKFMRACAARAEAFFSRFLIQNDLFTPALENLDIGKRNSGAVSSAILELLSFIEKTNLTSLVEHIHTKFYETYKAECPLVFEAIHVRYDGNSDSTYAPIDPAKADKVHFVRGGSIDDEEELYWEKETDGPESSTPEFDKNGLSEDEVSCQNRPRSIKLVDYDDDEEDPTTPIASPSTPSPRGDDSSSDDEKELKLPVRKKKEEEVDTQAFLGGSNVLAHKKQQKTTKKVRSPQYKNMFQKISWKLGTPDSSSNGNSPSSIKPADERNSEHGNNSNNGTGGDSNSNSVGSSDDGGDDTGSAPGVDTETTALIAAKRKLALDETPDSDSLLKKAKTCTPISSS